jgi:hypothetical protein
MNPLFSYLLSMVGSIPLPPIAGHPAYLDPGSGSFIVQVLVASLLAGLLVIRSFWSRITGFFRRQPPETPADAANHSTPDSKDPNP